MTRSAPLARLFLFAAAALIPACGTPQAADFINEDVQRRVQAAAEAVVTLDHAGRAALEAVVSSGMSSAGIQYPSRLDLTVDLAAVDETGRPRYPGVSGALRVQATGSPGQGSVSYAGTVTVIAALAYVDAVSGNLLRIAPESEWAFESTLQWVYRDSEDWSIAATSSESFAGLGFESSSSSGVLGGAVAGSCLAVLDYVRGAEGQTVAADGSSDRTATWTGVASGPSVSIRAAEPDSIMITVGETTFGPLTKSQVRAVFRVAWV